MKKDVPFYKNSNYIKTYHSFHLVDPSPWPFFAAYSVYMIALGFVSYIHHIKYGYIMLITGTFFFIIVSFSWLKDIVWEATFEDVHTSKVRKNFRLGFILFILSECMIFFSFFWAYFHSSLNPSIAIGGVWPPKAIITINYELIPLTNTFILISSGVSVTWAHSSVLARSKKYAIIGLIITLTLAILFLFLQGYEYLNASFNMSDGIYGSCFYATTGFHGFHVLIGTISLFISLNWLIFNHFTSNWHFGFEASIWYWHFVDVIWLFLYVIVYWWGGQ